MLANWRSDTRADLSKVSVKGLSKDFWFSHYKRICLNSASIIGLKSGCFGLKIYEKKEIPFPLALPFRFYSASQNLIAVLKCLGHNSLPVITLAR